MQKHTKRCSFGNLLRNKNKPKRFDNIRRIKYAVIYLSCFGPKRFSLRACEFAKTEFFVVARK